MSKYDSLRDYLQRLDHSAALSFAEIERILGFELPASALRYAAWWSNSGGTHVQSTAWLDAGCKTEDVDLEAQTVRFVPTRRGFGEMKQSAIGAEAPAREGGAQRKHHPAYGALKGMITLPPGLDLTEPAYADWKKLYGEG